MMAYVKNWAMQFSPDLWQFSISERTHFL